MEPYAPLRQALVQLLRGDGHAVLGTESAEEALVLSVSRRPALVLFGAKHPLEEGRAFLEWLARAGLQGSLPVVFLSSRAELPPGAAGVLEMPFTPAELRSVVARHTGGGLAPGGPTPH